MITAGGQPITLEDDGRQPWILKRVEKCFERFKDEVKLIYSTNQDLSGAAFHVIKGKNVACMGASESRLP
jgi:hypothetical protein